ncbi:MAG TPA: AAA family ATPase [Geobacteraceae bacterium]
MPQKDGSTAGDELKAVPVVPRQARSDAKPSVIESEAAIPGQQIIFTEAEKACAEVQAASAARTHLLETTGRPSHQEKAGYVSPSYTISRSVSLNPQVMLANRCVGFQQNSPELDYYRVLRTHILQRSRGGGNTVMVTSAHAGEGKTLTAINLAFTFAKEFKQTALLVDCDLRRQEIHKVLGYQSEKGLADYLLDDCPVQDLFVWPGVEKLTVISGGKTVGESSELLGSPGMKNLVAEMKNRYPERYVIFDVPPLLTSADPLAFAPLVDHIIVTVQAGETPLQDVNRALALLPGEKVLGLILNRNKKVLKPYGIQVNKKIEGASIHSKE